MSKMFHKVSFFLVISLVSVLAKSPCGDEPSHNIFLGKKEVWHELLMVEEVDLGELWFIKRTATLSYPKKDDPQVGVIYYMEIIDRYLDGNGGCATVTSGGVGENHTSIHFESQRSHGMRFGVTLYGIKRIQPLSTTTRP